MHHMYMMAAARDAGMLRMRNARAGLRRTQDAGTQCNCLQQQGESNKKRRTTKEKRREQHVQQQFSSGSGREEEVGDRHEPRHKGISAYPPIHKD